LVVEGELGIGKTTLLNWARATAFERGHLVLSASPLESEVPREFSALAELLGGVPQATIDALPEPQRRAFGVAVFGDEVPGEAIDPRTLATSVMRILRQLAEESPVVLGIDDLPWLDAPTARVISYALRRAGSAPLGLLGTVRTEWSNHPVDLVTDPVDPDRVDRLVVGPIGRAAMAELLAEWTEAPLSRSRLRTIQDLCRGNPLFASELAKGDSLESSELSARDDHSIDLPDSLRRLVRERLDRLTSGPRDITLLAALSDDPVVQVVLAAAGDPSDGEEDLHQGLDAGILHRSGDTLEFAHPLVRSVVAVEATTDQRQAAHQRLAAAVMQPEARARHLALGAEGPDEAIAHEVEEATTTAAARGACETAAALAELAVSLTPPGRTVDRHRRMAMEAENRFEASDPSGACVLLEEVTSAMEPGPERAELLRRLARYLAYGDEPLSRWIARLDTALEEAGDDKALRSAILQDQAAAAANMGDSEASKEYGELALRLAEQTGDALLRAQLAAGLAYVTFTCGEGVNNDLVQQGLSGPEQPNRVGIELRPRYVIGHLLHMSGDLDNARVLLQQEYEVALEQGIDTGLPQVLWPLIETELWAGNWERAEALSVDGSETAAQSGLPLAVALMACNRSLVHAYRGRLAEARHEAAMATPVFTAMGSPFMLFIRVAGLGLAELSVDDAAAAHRQLAATAEIVRAAGVQEPGLLRFLPDEIEALIQLGQLDQAIELLTPFERRSEELGRTWGQATSARCRALLLTAHGDIDAATHAIDLALEYHLTLGMPFEEGRTLLVAGEIHRRARRKSVAKSHLDASLATFERLGSPLWAEKAKSEIQRLGLRKAPGGSELTETERQVADLAISGLTNAQIALELFMSKRTVEAHLSRTYRKLGVKSRTQMARVYGTRQDHQPPERSFTW
jgi:DNA-binding NarL/FixJ family response regulator